MKRFIALIILLFVLLPAGVFYTASKAMEASVKDEKIMKHLSETSPKPVTTIIASPSAEPTTKNVLGATTKSTSSYQPLEKSLDMPTSIQQPNNTQAVKSLVQQGIDQYNSEITFLQQQQQVCSNELTKVTQKYDPQIKTLEDQENQYIHENCGSNKYAQACMGGVNARTISNYDRQIEDLTDAESRESNEVRVSACGEKPQVSVNQYIQKKLPTYYTITPYGNGYYIQGNNTFCNVTPYGNEYYVSCN